jgi:uncharacterized protein (DUF362 family)
MTEDIKTPAGIDRRLLLRRLGQAGLILGGSGVAAALGLRTRGRFAAAGKAAVIPARTVAPDPLRPGAVVARGGGTAAAMVRAAVERVGGMGRFVRRGESVLVKPNMAWDRAPEQGANTNPEVLSEVIRLCREAGAGRVVVAEVPVHDAARTAVRSGLERAAREAGAEFIVPPHAGFTTAAIRGAVLDEWEVFDPALKVDRLINVPVVKEHELSRMTCGLKNLYGFLGGNRGSLHQRIHVAIADLAVAFRPTLTVVDATRVMMRGGPQGGRLDDVRQVGAVGAGTDMVVLDAWAATLLGAEPRDIDHIVLAQGRGLGSLDVASIEEIHVGA